MATPSDIEKRDRDICGRIWTSPWPNRLIEDLCAEFGPRPTGSGALRNARKRLAAHLRTIGARGVRHEPVPVCAWRDEPSGVELLRPYKRPYASYHHVRSAPGKRTAGVIHVRDVADATLNDLDVRLKGKIALMPNRAISGGAHMPLQGALDRLSERGAAAALCYCLSRDLGPTMENAGGLTDASLPSLGISWEAGREMISFLDRGPVKVRIEATGTSYQTRCANLTAEMGNDRHGDETVVISAHLDSLPNTEGALDNLSGVATVLEVANALAEHQPRFRRRLRICLFTGEEYSFAGSRHYVDRHRGELDRIKFVFNLDTLAPSTARGVAVMGSPPMRDYIDRALRSAPHPVDVRNHFCMSSDYLPFMLEGVPTARPADWENALPPTSHTPSDCAAQLPAEWIRLNATPLAMMLIRMLTDENPLPARRNTRDEVAGMIRHAGAAEAIRARGLDHPVLD